MDTAMLNWRCLDSYVSDVSNVASWSYDVPEWDTRDSNGYVMRKAYMRALMKVAEAHNRVPRISKA
jgi:hypothetical protein